MTAITTRAGKGSPLTNAELDANFNNLNANKLETSGGTLSGALTWGPDNTYDIGANGANRPRNVYVANNYIGGGSVTIAVGGFLSWGGTRTTLRSDGDGLLRITNAAATANVTLAVDASDTLGLRNGANPQSFNVYNTYTNVSNGEWGSLSWSSNTLVLSTNANGTGAARGLKLVSGLSLVFVANGNQAWQVNTAGHLTSPVDNTYDIGQSGANRPRNLYVGGTITAGSTITSSGNVVAGAAGGMYFAGRSKLASPSDGVLTLGNNGGTDFSLLQFGGQTAGFPALKRSAATLQARLADDTGYADFYAGTLYSNGLAVGSDGFNVGDMILTTNVTPRTNWLFATGWVASQSAYPALYNTIKHTFGTFTASSISAAATGTSTVVGAFSINTAAATMLVANVPSNASTVAWSSDGVTWATSIHPNNECIVAGACFGNVSYRYYFVTTSGGCWLHNGTSFATGAGWSGAPAGASPSTVKVLSGNPSTGTLMVYGSQTSGPWAAKLATGTGVLTNRTLPAITNATQVGLQTISSSAYSYGAAHATSGLIVLLPYGASYSGTSYWYSTDDGATWSVGTAPSGITNTSANVARISEANGKIFLSQGTSIYYTTNGTTWSGVNLNGSALYNPSAVSFPAGYPVVTYNATMGLYILSGCNTSVGIFVSNDLNNWAITPASSLQQGVVTGAIGPGIQTTLKYAGADTVSIGTVSVSYTVSTQFQLPNKQLGVGQVLIKAA